MNLKKTYIICSTMRSGSTLLCDLLSHTKLVGQPQEFFLAEWEKKSKLDSSNYPEYIQKTLESFASSNGVSGVKLMWCNCQEVLQRLHETSETTSKSDLELLKEVFPNLKFIFISRRNKVRQAISLARSIKTKRWNKYQDSQNPGKISFNRYDNISNSPKNPYPYISPGTVEVYLSQIEKDEKAWFQFFENNNIEPQIIIYEELAQNKQKNIVDVLSFLEIPVSEDINFNSSFKKQADFYTDLLLVQYHSYTLLKKWVSPRILKMLSVLKDRFKNRGTPANSKS
ncbi:sulfotransferase domain protein [Lyngbya aestuarii BL J]|uniref:Sulfotransferase domain protein n=1 Tax=Lyngbya aestuarii BL J TaxID=1348334 RepID=U7QJM3_9CYAN|nr:Stf0 family sulfotransferase [Lyngbya aestuarii]ERT08169.1 sulfotransferase domain protein [Lyngbya aestuarii BL J]